MITIRYFTFQDVMRRLQKLGAKCELEEAKEAFMEIAGGGDKVDLELFKAFGQCSKACRNSDHNNYKG